MVVSKNFQNEFVKIFREARKRGYSIKEIKSKLLDQGYPLDLLNKLILKYCSKQIGKYTLIITAVFFAFMLVFSFFVSPTCETPACFVKAADECLPRVYLNEEAGSLVKYQITSDCFLIKHMLRVAETEPIKVRDMFLDKFMVCEFPSHKFNPNFFKLTWGLEFCEGPLKKAILSIIGAACPAPCEEVTPSDIETAKEPFPYWLLVILFLLLLLLYYFYRKWRKKKKNKKLYKRTLSNTTK